MKSSIASMERFEMSATPQSKGGKSRAKSLSAEQRREIARQGARARWDAASVPEGVVVPKTIASGILKVGNIPCAVLDDESNTRVLTQSGFLSAIGRFPNPKSVSNTGLAHLPAFLRAKNLEPFISSNLADSSTPVIFETERRGGAGGGRALGYKAQLLPDVCWVYAKAQMARKLVRGQEHIAEACTKLLEALTNVAIDALVDEATGFQDIRAKDALIKLLEKYISKDALPWVKTFDDDFYRNMFKLHGYEYNPASVKRPMIFAKRTEDIYNRLAPGARKRLQDLVARYPSGRAKEKLFQHLTQDDGYQALLEIIRDAKIVMKLSSTPKEYERNLDKIHPRFDVTLPLPLDD